MPSPIESVLDPIRLRAMQIRRRIRGEATAEKLALLRRLRERHDEHGMRGYRETRIEQSFNEQLFARIFGYQTLFSHDRIPFHLLPKNYFGSNRYDDFSLGFFGGESARTIASAELKGPHTALNRSQTSGSYAGLTPVEQAFRATGDDKSCRWVLVCNFRDLWLYSVKNRDAPIARADLHAVATRDDLAALLAHFDKAALLGEPPTEAEMTTAMDQLHPSSPVPVIDGHFRVVLRFLMADEARYPLFKIEQGLRSACERAPFMPDDSYGRRDPLRIHMTDGWIWTERPARGTQGVCRFGCSRGGELFLSVQVKFAPVRRNGQPIALILAADLVDVATEFVLLCTLFRRANFGSHTPPGFVTLDVDGATGASLATGPFAPKGGDDEGEAPGDHIAAGEFPWALDDATAGSKIAECLLELGIQFRAFSGGIRLDEQSIVGCVQREQKRLGGLQ